MMHAGPSRIPLASVPGPFEQGALLEYMRNMTHAQDQLQVCLGQTAERLSLCSCHFVAMDRFLPKDHGVAGPKAGMSASGWV